MLGAILVGAVAILGTLIMIGLGIWAILSDFNR